MNARDAKTIARGNVGRKSWSKGASCNGSKGRWKRMASKDDRRAGKVLCRLGRAEA